MLELITFALAFVMLAMTVHGGVLTSPDKHRKWFIIYGVAGFVLVIAQGFFLHFDSKTKDKESGDLKEQIILLVNASKTQATIGDIRSIGDTISNGFHDVEIVLANCFKGKLPKAIPSGITPVLPPTPQIEHIQITERRTTSDIEGIPWGWQVIMQANDTIQPVGFRIECDAPIEKASAFIAGQAVYLQRAEQFSQDKKSYSFSFHYPPLTPMSPLVVTVFSKQDIHITKIEKIQPLF
jgi:hypothetical protein